MIMKQNLFMIIALVTSALSINANDVIILSSSMDDDGKYRPTIVTPPTVDYEKMSRTLTIKSDDTIEDATITIRDIRGNAIMLQSTTLQNGQARINVPENVDKAKHSIELSLDKEVYKGIF